MPIVRSDKISRMGVKVLFSEDPAFVLRRTDKFLSSEPVLHNLILSILHSRVTEGDPGRYWIALHEEETVGVVVQSPLEYPATLTPMGPQAVMALVDAIAEAGVTLPGVNGDAATAASFAGQWSERCKSAAAPFQGTRLYEFLGYEFLGYEFLDLGKGPPTEGHLRQAGPRDRSLMILWTRAFQDEIGESANDTEIRVDRWLAAGQIWVWDRNGETTSMAVSREPAQGVVRLSGVYTPPEKRKHGYAAACVHALSKQLRGRGYRCILYTDLGNPTSNSIYRRIGYKAVAEALRYRFD
jgi:GNAT superfamily N-acetyltransferase